MEEVDLQEVREEAEVFVSESKDEDWCWGGNVEEERLVKDDARDDIEGMIREDDGEVAFVDENERTGRGVEVVKELEEEAFCELKDIVDNMELEGEVVCEVVCEEVELGIKNEGVGSWNQRYHDSYTLQMTELNETFNCYLCVYQCV